MDVKDPYYQTLLLKMLGHLTLLFDEKNFERKQGSMSTSQGIFIINKAKRE